MSVSSVTWRQAVAAVVATVVAMFAITIVVRSDGIPAVDAAAGRATGWFLHQPTGRVVLVDGYDGRALASLETGTQGEDLRVIDSGSGAFLLNAATAEARPVDSAELRLGTPFGLSALTADAAFATVSRAGLVVVDPDADEANVVPPEGEPLTVAVEANETTQVAPDGSIWSLIDGDLVRTTSSESEVIRLGAPGAHFALVGNEPFVVDVENSRARFGAGSWIPLSATVDASEIITQVSGPAADCGWVAAAGDLWCVGARGIDETVTLSGLDIDGSDTLAIAGDAAVLVRRGPSSIVRFDWRSGRILDELTASVASDATLAVSATVDLVWIDDIAGDIVWSVTPWGVQAIDKDADGILVLDEDGDVVDGGQSGRTSGQVGDTAASQTQVRQPDGNGLDDPPVAVDDSVTARSGASVRVEVTANDYDPDGEAVAMSAVGVPGHGTVDIGTASTVVYTPDPSYVGVDEFDYTIVDGDGTTATATVVIELLPPGSTNRAPIGVEDVVSTGPDTPVIVDVLLNDVDPERDALALGGFSSPPSTGLASLGEVSETIGPSGLPALRFAPTEGFEGTASFTYRPIDALGAVGDDVDVRVDVARDGDENRPPVVQPDAVRLRRDVPTRLPVLVNDSDPDGDQLTLTVVEPLVGGLEVGVEGEQLVITARAGAPTLAPFEYRVDDGAGAVVRGAVLVSVLDEREPNRPPVVTADVATTVVGRSTVIDVTSNDVDPDGDPLTITSVTQPGTNRGQAVVFSRNEIQFSPGPSVAEEDQGAVRLTYTVSDGNGHEVGGQLTVTVLPEELSAPPFARDDSTFTFVDVPVTIDVLRNDGDPSGGSPMLAGRPGCPSGGLATVTPDAQIRFDPPSGASGAFRCTYEVTNERGLRASASIIVSVREPDVANRPPETVNDTLTVEVATVTSIDVLANDSDPDGDDTELELVSSTAPTLGTATRSGGTITFVAGSIAGNTTISYQVADGDGAVSVGRLLIRITEPGNRPPIAISDTQTVVAPAAPQLFNVLANDSDPDETRGGLSVLSATRVSGEATVTLSGSIVTVAADRDFVGEIVASYTISDGEGLTATASVVLTVEEPLNRAPEARDDTVDVDSGGTVTAAILFNDNDPDGDDLAVSLTGGADSSLGSAVLRSDRSVTFTAAPGASGTAVISYQVTDGELTDTAVLRVVIRPCGESAPVAGSPFLRTGYLQPIAIDLAAYAANGSVVDVVAPAGFADGVYTPPVGENGNVTIRYSVVNSCRLRESGLVTIDVNSDPVVAAQSVAVLRGTTITVPVTQLASDDESLAITGSAGGPAWVTIEPDRLVLSPPVGVAPGAFPFTVTVSDPGGLSSTVNVTVTVGNEPPIANADVVDVTDGRPTNAPIVDNDTDVDSAGGLTIQSISATIITFTNGETGSVSVNGNGRSVSIDPKEGAGTATFSYTVRDDDGGVSAPATVTVNGPAVNVAPVARDQTVAIDVGVSRALDLEVEDANGDLLTVFEIDDPGLVVESVTGVVMTLLATAPGTFTVSYLVSDGVLASDLATVTIVAT